MCSCLLFITCGTIACLDVICSGGFANIEMFDQLWHKGFSYLQLKVVLCM